MEKQYQGKLGGLLDAGGPLRSGMLMELSDAGGETLRELRLGWKSLPVERRRKIVRRLVEIAEDDVEADFRGALRVFLKDDDAEVRVAALDGLWEDEAPSTLDTILGMLAGDPITMARAAAARALSIFAMAASLGELRGGRGPALRQALEDAYHRSGEEQEVRCQVLRALGYFEDDLAGELISEAYGKADTELRASAVCAMGENLNPRWAKSVRLELSSPHPELRFEAATAAGNMELKEAVTDLVELTADSDVDVRLAAIAALGQIGGAAAKRALAALARSGHAATREAARSAMDELRFLAAPLDVPAGGIPAVPAAKPPRPGAAPA